MFLLSGCHLVDDEIDLPEPEQPAEELIVGRWRQLFHHISSFNAEGKLVGSFTDDEEAVFEFTEDYA